MAFAFALEVVLPGNRKMYPDVTTGWQLLQTPKRYNRNIRSLSLCLAVRSTCERHRGLHVWQIYKPCKAWNYNLIFYRVSLVLTWTISDWKPSSFFTGRSGKMKIMFQLYSILDKCLFYGNFKYHNLAFQWSYRK